MIGERAAPASVLDLLPAALAATPVELPEGEGLDAAAVQLRFFAVQAARSGRSDVAEAVEHLLATLASGAGATTGADAAGTSKKRAVLLLDAALALSRRERPEATARDAVLLSRVGQSGGTVRRVGLEALAGLCRELPLSIAEHLWSQLLESRGSL